MSEIFAERVKQCREETGFSISMTSTATGYSRATVQRYEKGKHEPTLETAIKFGMAFNVNPAWLCGWSGRKEPVETEKG